MVKQRVLLPNADLGLSILHIKQVKLNKKKHTFNV